MIIVSQDKDSIVNFDNIEEVYINQDLRDVDYSILSIGNTCGHKCLGTYKTEKRAKEVLQEIGMVYANLEMLKYPKFIPNGTIEAPVLKEGLVYEMPEE